MGHLKRFALCYETKISITFSHKFPQSLVSRFVLRFIVQR